MPAIGGTLLIHIQMNPHERQEYEREVADLRASMSDHQFKSLWSQGRALTMEEAIELALHS